METIWNTLKYILANETDLLINKHIDTIILCCFYSVTKIFKNPMKFQEIISKYEVNFFNLKKYVF